MLGVGLLVQELGWEFPHVGNLGRAPSVGTRMEIPVVVGGAASAIHIYVLAEPHPSAHLYYFSWSGYK